jgi:DNA-binding protein H-NS
MTYKKMFNLNPSDIDLIETCLRHELHIRSEKCQCEELVKQENAEEMDSSKQRISEITELLGKIHNQKIWYDGDPAKPWVPKG